MQARANDMHTLATSSFNAKMRALGGGSPDNPGMHRCLLVEMRKMRRRGVVDSLECARSAPAKAEGGLWAHSAISRFQLVKAHITQSLSCHAASPPPSLQNAPQPLLTDLTNTDYR